MNFTLIIGQEYRNGHGGRVNIQGHTRDNKSWAFSTQGNWYEQATGLFLWYQSKDGSYLTRGDAGEGRNLCTQ